MDILRRARICGRGGYGSDNSGMCYIPSWMFKMLQFAEEGVPAQITLVNDMIDKKNRKPYFIKLRPHKTKFIELDNPKAVLEYQLRNFTCLHEGDTITISTFSGKF
jgi:ubiquitin fusion degradation protein 1